MTLGKIQQQFSEFCRGKDLGGLQVDARRAAVYAELIFEKVEGALGRVYPITRSSIDEEIWKKMVSDFFHEHESTTPYFWKMSEHLCFFAKEKNISKRYQIPHLEDLLAFEWAETEVYMMKDGHRRALKSDGDIFEDPLFINPDHLFSQFSYPVFQKDVSKKGSYFLLTYRHFGTKEVHFLQLSRFYQSVLQLLHQNPMSGMEALQHVAALFAISLDEKLIAFSENFFKDLLHLGVIEGYIV